MNNTDSVGARLALHHLDTAPPLLLAEPWGRLNSSLLEGAMASLQAHK